MVLLCVLGRRCCPAPHPVCLVSTCNLRLPESPLEILELVVTTASSLSVHSFAIVFDLNAARLRCEFFHHAATTRSTAANGEHCSDCANESGCHSVLQHPGRPQLDRFYR